MRSTTFRSTVCGVALLVAVTTDAKAQQTATDIATMNSWAETAKKTEVGNQLISVFTSTNAILKSTPHHKRALYLRGYLYGTIGCTTSAIADLSKLIETDPSYAAAYTERGICYMDQKNFEKARQDFDRAIQLNPLSGDAHLARGKLLLEMDRPTSALSDLASCKQLAFAPALPGELPANYYGAPDYYLGAAYEAMGRPESAAKYYKTSIKPPRLGGSGYIHRFSDQPLDAKYRLSLTEGPQ
ncbi:MAG: tetratricopeptide repeat protein [Candidatus Obscuribacterales bacterium]